MVIMKHPKIVNNCLVNTFEIPHSVMTGQARLTRRLCLVITGLSVAAVILARVRC